MANDETETNPLNLNDIKEALEGFQQELFH